MDTKKKLLIAITAVSIALVITITTLVIVLVASNQSASSNVTVEYTSTEVSAMVSATYTVGNKTYAMKNGNEATLVFRPGLRTSGSLKADSSITLDETNNSVVFEYTFINTSDVSHINIALDTETNSKDNINILYYGSEVKVEDYSTLSNSASSTWTDQYLSVRAGTIYVYVICSIADSSVDAICSGSFNWELTRYQL